jgi:quinoprotein glucose dehydrogenase
MKWYFQMVHHPIWDLDASSPPLLVDINVDGKPIKAVAVPGKEAWLYTFDRITGKPVWPIVEKPVTQSDVPGEKTAKTQPYPTKPAPYARQLITDAELVDFTPELHAKAEAIVKQYYKMAKSPVFEPPVVSNPTGGYPSAMLGTAPGAGTNWPGSGFNPETQVVFAPSGNGVSLQGLVPLPEGLSDLKYDAGTGGQVFRISGGPGFGSASDAPKVSSDDEKLAAALAAHPQHPIGPPPPRTVEGLPLQRPPYGTITAINLNTGDTLWHVANGDTPDEIRDNPALKGVNIPRTGQNDMNTGGLMMTKSLVINGDGAYTTQPGHPRGAYLRAFDQKTGNEVGAVYMPAPESADPMSYTYDGKQYIMVAVSGGNYSGDYLAYALPQ